MGKKVKRKKYVSKGERRNVSKANSFDTWSLIERALFKAEARAAGKRVCETIPNPDKTNTKARFIRVCVNG